MTIKTAVTLGTGAAVGFLFGLMTEQQAKERIVRQIRRKIFYALTGEEMPKKRNNGPVPKYRPVTYSQFYSRPVKKESVSDSEKQKDWFDMRAKLLCFETRDEAHEFYDELMKFVKDYGFLSVSDLCNKREVCCEYVWNKYGWQEEDIRGISIIGPYSGTEKPEKKYYILDMPGPKSI